MRRFSTALFTATIAAAGSFAALSWPSGAQTPDPGAEPVFVELFTSQGCSSCPPADRLAEKLDREGGVVVISRPVTYWDRLGWKDTLASAENTELQRDYAQRGLAGYNGVYTPQSVVDGSAGEVGSREAALRRMIAREAAEYDAAIRVRGAENRGFAVGVAGSTERQAELVLIGVTRRAEVAIGRGENGGRRIGYTNVLRGERKLADWNGGKASHVIEPSALNMREADRYAVVVREPDAGRVLAARWLD